VRAESEALVVRRARAPVAVQHLPGWEPPCWVDSDAPCFAACRYKTAVQNLLTVGNRTPRALERPGGPGTVAIRSIVAWSNMPWGSREGAGGSLGSTAACSVGSGSAAAAAACADLGISGAAWGGASVFAVTNGGSEGAPTCSCCLTLQ
jgi:hypothetical protein